jgi:hypothetical protein
MQRPSNHTRRQGDARMARVTATGNARLTHDMVSIATFGSPVQRTKINVPERVIVRTSYRWREDCIQE